MAPSFPISENRRFDLDEATIRVLRDIAGAVVTGIREVQADCAGDPPPPPPPTAPPPYSMFGIAFGSVPKTPPGPLDVVATVCAHIRDALDEHLPECREANARADRHP
jgi:hypothetical protein